MNGEDVLSEMRQWVDGRFMVVVNEEASAVVLLCKGPWTSETNSPCRGLTSASCESNLTPNLA
jgi:hypothetical protein